MEFNLVIKILNFKYKLFKSILQVHLIFIFKRTWKHILKTIWIIFLSTFVFLHFFYQYFYKKYLYLSLIVLKHSKEQTQKDKNLSKIMILTSSWIFVLFKLYRKKLCYEFLFLIIQLNFYFSISLYQRNNEKKWKIQKVNKNAVKILKV